MSSVVSRIVELGNVVDHDRLSILDKEPPWQMFTAHAQCLFSGCWQKTYENCVRYNKMSSVVSRIVEFGTIVDHDRLRISRYRITLANIHCTCAVPFLVSSCWQKTWELCKTQ